MPLSPSCRPKSRVATPRSRRRPAVYVPPQMASCMIHHRKFAGVEVKPRCGDSPTVSAQHYAAHGKLRVSSRPSDSQSDVRGDPRRAGTAVDAGPDGRGGARLAGVFRPAAHTSGAVREKSWDSRPLPGRPSAIRRPRRLGEKGNGGGARDPMSGESGSPAARPIMAAEQSDQGCGQRLAGFRRLRITKAQVAVPSSFGLWTPTIFKVTAASL
jgi:hypothetical protein